MSLSLVLHELATNAAKYGALSVSGGRVQVSWQVEDANGQLRIKWAESGGPPVTPPATTGYGTRLIPYTTTYSLRSEEHTSELQSLMRISYAVFCLKTKTT